MDLLGKLENVLKSLETTVNEATSVPSTIHNEVQKNKHLVLSSVKEVNGASIKWKIVFHEPVSLFFHMKSVSNDVSLELEKVESVIFSDILNTYTFCFLHFNNGENKEFYILPDIYKFNFEIKG